MNLHSSGRHSCGIAKATSAVYCWGANFDGALGDGTTVHRDYPVAVVSRVAVRSP
ncbi:MAG TPA: RCC1 domain-containing protein [Gemmatimonadaceae bacterium]